MDVNSMEKSVWEALETCYDPEIPINIVELGLVYDCKVTLTEKNKNKVQIKMTLTAPGCEMSQLILTEVEEKVKTLPEVQDVDVDVVFDPPWTVDMMTERARLELGL